MSTSQSVTQCISFILPVFNVAPFIEKCLKSIEAQSCDRWEAILVDDGSTDRSSEICKEWALRNPKFRYIRQENRGQGSARNLGISLASGDFVCFVDPDDWIEDTTAYHLLQALDISDADFLNYGIDFISETGKTKRTFNDFSQIKMEGRDIFRNAMIDKEIYSTPCNKAYRTSFLKSFNVFFPETRAYEDIVFSRLLAFNSKKCIFIEKVFYHALIRRDSTTRLMTSAKVSEAIHIIQVEKKLLLGGNPSPDDVDLFDAHVVKFAASLLLQCAFRVQGGDEYMHCFRLIQTSDLLRAIANPNAMRNLKTTHRVFAYLGQKPYLTRAVAKTLSLLGIQPY